MVSQPGFDPPSIGDADPALRVTERAPHGLLIQIFPPTRPRPEVLPHITPGSLSYPFYVKLRIRSWCDWP